MRAASTPACSPISRIVVPSNPRWPKRARAAWSRASLLAAASRDRPGQALPDVDGFKVALIIAAAVCLATAVVSFVLPGRAATSPGARTAGAEEDLGVLVRNEAGLGGASPAAGGKPLPPGLQEDRP